MYANSSLSHAAPAADFQRAQPTDLHAMPAPPLAGDVAATSSQTGRPSLLSDRMVAVLCSIVRATGTSDSSAAAQANLHPSTISRWKRDFPELAILLRSAREEFRAAQLNRILATASAGGSGGWRAAAWLLERIFPQDYSPRARERAHFQEMEEAALARETDAMEHEPAPSTVDPLQNVQNSAERPPGSEAPRSEAVPASQPCDGGTPSLLEPPAQAPALHHLRKPLQNVQKSPLSGSIVPPTAATKPTHERLFDMADEPRIAVGAR